MAMPGIGLYNHDESDEVLVKTVLALVRERGIEISDDHPIIIRRHLEDKVGVILNRLRMAETTGMASKENEMKKVKIKVCVSKAAAVEAGYAEYGTVVIEADPGPLTAEQRAELIEAGDYSDANEMGDGKYPLATVTDLNIGDLLTWRLGIRAKHAAEELEKETARVVRERAVLEQIREMVEADQIKFVYHRDGDPTGIRWPSRDLVGLEYRDRESYQIVRDDDCERIMKDRLASAHADWAEADSRKKAEERVAEERAEAETVRSDAVTDELIRDILVEKLMVDEGSRYERGFFSEQDERDLLRNNAWGNRGKKSDRYERLCKGDVDHAQECCDGDIEFSVSSYDKALTPGEFDQLRKIEKAFDGSEWQVVIRQHVGECEDCESTVERLSVLVSTQVGKYKLSREYSLSE
jgi:hypothetical protein